MVVIKPVYICIFHITTIRLKRIGHPVRSAIHKLVIHLLITLNRANRHSVESEPLATLRVSDLGVIFHIRHTCTL